MWQVGDQAMLAGEPVSIAGFIDDPALKAYTLVSDRFAPFATQTILATVPITKITCLS